ncbi:MAG TPA: hypothetical protein DEH78_19275, partial [Solibacterales bacterium]|nr:hypothetical protein [Bryobacterales bacterium]
EYQGVDYHCSGRVRARTRRGLESYLRRYPPGARIQVLVNPENPADALVEPRVSRGWLVLAVLLAVAGAALISTPVIGGRIFGRASF